MGDSFQLNKVPLPSMLLSGMLADKILEQFPHTTTNASPEQVSIILKELETVILKGVPGEVCELGCHKGLTSVYIKRLLDAMKCNKVFHCYDSFQGLPEKMEQDINPEGKHKDHFVKGLFNNTQFDDFVDYFAECKLQLPEVHIGWFKEMTYPDLISFAFLDGDFYSSIMDSLELTWHKIAQNGTVCVHDYGWEELPGVKTAVDEFFKGKLNIETPCQGLAIIRKL